MITEGSNPDAGYILCLRWVLEYFGTQNVIIFNGTFCLDHLLLQNSFVLVVLESIGGAK